MKRSITNTHTDLCLKAILNQTLGEDETMTTDDARVGMLKIRNLREGLMDSYEYLHSVGDPYDKLDQDYTYIVNTLYECVTHMDRISKIISDFATSKARDPKHFT